jgi:hypothetical protein
MRDPETALLEEVKVFIAEHGMSESRFGMEAVNDNHLLNRLRTSSVTLRTVKKIKAYMQRIDDELERRHSRRLRSQSKDAAE